MAFSSTSARLPRCAIRADSSPKLVPACTYPLTGIGYVSRVYTDLAIFDLTGGGEVPA